MINNKTAAWLTMLGVVMILDTAAAEEGDHRELVAIIAAIERGWEQADGQPFRDHYLDFDGARYFESGGQNQGLDDLVHHHVEPEGDGFEEFDLDLGNIETHFEGDFAWALADVELRAVRSSNGESLHLRGYETFLFRRTSEGWKIVHTHSSTRAAK